MVDVEKVIKGLEICQKKKRTGVGCLECPYAKAEGEIDDWCVRGLYHDALVLLKEQEAVKPRYIDGKRNHFIVCGNCNTDLIRGMKYCSYCGKAVRWK